MKRFIIIIAAALAMSSCKGGGSLLPNISGKAGEVLVVMDKTDWEGTLGNDVRGLLACDCNYLAQQEPLYTLVNVVPSGFIDLFKIHRNILMIDINPQADSAKVVAKQNIWAAPQCVIQIESPDVEGVSRILDKKGEFITGTIEQAERNRVIANCLQYEQGDITRAVRAAFPGTLRYPIGYTAKKVTEDFVWVADEKMTILGLFLYKYPVDSAEPFSIDNIVAHRNEILMKNVPGMKEGSYMTTGTVFPLQLEYIKYKGRDIAQLRGMWEVENDWMGGPFVSHSFYSKDGKDIIVAEAFVYAPKYDKRQYLRQVESILYSWEWSDDSTAENKEK